MVTEKLKINYKA